MDKVPVKRRNYALPTHLPTYEPGKNDDIPNNISPALKQSTTYNNTIRTPRTPTYTSCIHVRIRSLDLAGRELLFTFCNQHLPT